MKMENDDTFGLNYSCNLCGKRYSLRSSLRRHERISHKEEALTLRLKPVRVLEERRQVVAQDARKRYREKHKADISKKAILAYHRKKAIETLTERHREKHPIPFPPSPPPSCPVTPQRPSPNLFLLLNDVNKVDLFPQTSRCLRSNQKRISLFLHPDKGGDTRAFQEWQIILDKYMHNEWHYRDDKEAAMEYRRLMEKYQMEMSSYERFMRSYNRHMDAFQKAYDMAFGEIQFTEAEIKQELNRRLYYCSRLGKRLGVDDILDSALAEK